MYKGCQHLLDLWQEWWWWSQAIEEEGTDDDDYDSGGSAGIALTPPDSPGCMRQVVIHDESLPPRTANSIFGQNSTFVLIRTRVDFLLKWTGEKYKIMMLYSNDLSPLSRWNWAVLTKRPRLLSTRQLIPIRWSLFLSIFWTIWRFRTSMQSLHEIWPTQILTKDSSTSYQSLTSSHITAWKRLQPRWQNHVVQNTEQATN